MKEEIIKIEHYPTIQNNEVDNPTLWLRVQFSHQSGTDEWSTIPIDAIEGFDYELGSTYDIRIRKEEALNQSTGKYYIKYTYLSEIAKTPTSSMTTFEMPLKSNDFNPSNLVLGSAGSGYSLLGEIPIDCASLCDDLENSLATSGEVTGLFRHNGQSIRLIQLK
ncbi:hypothetical protein GCM10028791_33280 [Echinicola sediminis]